MTSSPPRRGLRDRPVDRAANMVAPPPLDDTDDPGRFFTAADVREIVTSGALPQLIDRARASERAARDVRLWFEALASQGERSCPVCGSAVRGRADRLYCSGACRQKAHRASQPQP